MRIHDVERSLVEWQPLGVTFLDSGVAESAHFEMTPRERDRFRRKVDGCHSTTDRCEVNQVHSRTAANFQNVLALKRAGRDDVAQVRHLLVAVPDQLLEELGGTDGRLDDLDIVYVRGPVALDVRKRCGCGHQKLP